MDATMTVDWYFSCKLISPSPPPLSLSLIVDQACVDPEVGTGGPDPLENHKPIGPLTNTGLEPLKITKLNGSLAILVWNPWKITKVPSQHLIGPLSARQ